MPKIISDLAIMLLTAGVVAVVFKRFKLPLVLGYILAGFLVGPYMPWFFTVADQASIETWSEIGIIVLMFGLGLEFNLHKLVSVGGTAIITALTEVFGMLVVGYLVGQAMGWGMMDSIFLGGMLSMSSTTIIIKAFDELGVRQEPFAQLVFGTLVIEDIAGIFMMIILSTVSVSKSISGGALALQLGMLVLYLALWLILGIYILPTLLRKAEKFMNDETLLLASLGICFGMVLLAEALGFSSALGAFLAGSLLARHGTCRAGGAFDLRGQGSLRLGLLPLRRHDAEPGDDREYIVPILIITLVTIMGKLTISTLGVLLSGQSLSKAIHCGCSLAQIGEFAFIIASLGMSLGVIEEKVYPIVVAVSTITTLTTPFFIKSADKIYGAVSKALPKKLSDKLERYTHEDDKVREDSDWGRFMRRYVKVTALYGVLMMGVTLLGQFVLYPLLDRAFPGQGFVRPVCVAFCVLGIALFVRPDAGPALYRVHHPLGEEPLLPPAPDHPHGAALSHHRADRLLPAADPAGRKRRVAFADHRGGRRADLPQRLALLRLYLRRGPVHGQLQRAQPPAGHGGHRVAGREALRGLPGRERRVCGKNAQTAGLGTPLQRERDPGAAGQKASEHALGQCGASGGRQAAGDRANGRICAHCA